jgi:hypothetical protein
MEGLQQAAVMTEETESTQGSWCKYSSIHAGKEQGRIATWQER